MDTKSFNEKNFGKSRAVCDGIEREDGGGDYKTEANNLRYQLNASERKSEGRLRQIDYLESVIRKRNAELKERKQLVHELRNEVRRLGKQVSDLSAEREDGGGRVVLTDRERQILDMWPRFEDAGEPVWLGDSFADNKGESREIEGITLFSHGIDLYDDEGFHKPLDYGERLTRARADSWERLEEDALKDVCEYAEASSFGHIDASDCDTCRFYNEGDDLSCEEKMASDIIRRAKALAGVEE